MAVLRASSPRFVRANILAAELLLETILNVNRAECERITRPSVGAELPEDLLSLPKTSEQSPAGRLPIVDGKTPIWHASSVLFIDNKEVKI